MAVTVALRQSYEGLAAHSPSNKSFVVFGSDALPILRRRARRWSAFRSLRLRYSTNALLGCVSPPIGQTLSFRAFDCALRALRIRPAELGARVVAEFKFREIAVKMLFIAVLINAAHAALEHGEV